ncbi:hypothetical protein DL96DRAFT_1705153 [Flagelloscypha sp. PMI_526]|nr:hypothetical protein DL96DRAFT_1705153 [Flagelloscypha sp. PMI_526]
MTASLDGTFDIETAIKGSLEASMEATKQLCHDYPLTARVVGGGAIVAGSALLAPAAVGVAGFGSLAALVQSYVYGGATGGIFAGIQSYAALNVAGAVSTIVGGLGLAGGAVVLKNVDGGDDHSDPPKDLAKSLERDGSCECGDNPKGTTVEDDREEFDRKEEADNTHQEDYTVHYQVKL